QEHGARFPRLRLGAHLVVVEKHCSPLYISALRLFVGTKRPAEIGARATELRQGTTFIAAKLGQAGFAGFSRLCANKCAWPDVFTTRAGRTGGQVVDCVFLPAKNRVARHFPRAGLRTVHSGRPVESAG